MVSLDAKRLAKELRSLLEDILALFARHVPPARQMLKKLLDGHIVYEPIMDGGKAGYRFTATGTFDRLLTGVRIGNNGGGGQPRHKLFQPQNQGAAAPSPVGCGGSIRALFKPENLEDFTALRGSHRGQGRQRGTVPRSPYKMSAVLT